MGQEVWVDIKGWEGYYQISNMGQVRSVERVVVYSNGRPHLVLSKILKLKKKDFGHLEVTLCRNCKQYSCLVHRLVALHFIDNPFNYEYVLHGNDIPHDNRSVNLKWGTQKHNIEQAVARNRMSSGDNHYMRKIPVSQKPKSRLVIDLQTGIFYDSISDAAFAKGIKAKKLQDAIYNAKNNIYNGITYA